MGKRRFINQIPQSERRSKACVVLLEGVRKAGTCTYNDLFVDTQPQLKEIYEAASEENLRLTIYELLQNLVGRGEIIRNGKKYSAFAPKEKEDGNECPAADWPETPPTEPGLYWFYGDCAYGSMGGHYSGTIPPETRLHCVEVQEISNGMVAVTSGRFMPLQKFDAEKRGIGHIGVWQPVTPPTLPDYTAKVAAPGKRPKP